MSEQSDSDDIQVSKQSKIKPLKILPTDRLGFDKQLIALKAFVAASGSERKAVSNNEVSAIAGIHSGTISNCNPFFNDVGFLIRDGLKQKPSDELLGYVSRLDWEEDDAAHKLAPLIEKSWFAKSLLPKLAFRPLSREEAVSFLADEAKAAKGYKQQLEMLLDYLHVSGLINIDGNSVILAKRTKPDISEIKNPQSDNGISTERPNETDDDLDVENFNIPIPGKASAKIIIPKNLDAADWTMLTAMLNAYISRMQNKATREGDTITKGDK